MRGYFKKSQLIKVECLPGYENTARDLETLAALLRGALPTIVGKSAVTSADVDQAAALSAEIRHVLELRAQEEERAVASNDERARAFTLLSKTYAEVRHSTRYLRENEGGADVLMPSLCGRRRK